MTCVLIVDDEPDIVLFLQVNLELSGYEVLTAANGEEALALVRERHPDALVLDVMMPRLDGWGVLERLKADQDELIRTIPVVLLTALSGDHDQVRGGIEGAVRYLTKPITPDELLAALEAALDGDPEPVQRKAAQQRALERLARLEGGSAEPAPGAASAPRPRLGRLEHLRTRDPSVRSTPEVVLSDSQRSLLLVLSGAPSVSDAAQELGTSRSNVYATLRRIGRKLGEPDVSELLRRLRAGDLAPLLEG